MQKKLAVLPHVVEVRGRGLLAGCEYDIPIAGEVKRAALKRRALITVIGDNVNRMIPPLTATKRDVDRLIDIMSEAIEEVAGGQTAKAG